MCRVIFYKCKWQRIWLSKLTHIFTNNKEFYHNNEMPSIIIFINNKQVSLFQWKIENVALNIPYTRKEREKHTENHNWHIKMKYVNECEFSYHSCLIFYLKWWLFFIFESICFSVKSSISISAGKISRILFI